MIKNFRHACVVVRDLERSLKFYRDILGLKVFKILTIKGKYPNTVLNKKGIELIYAKMCAPNQSKKSPPIFELHYWQKPKILPRPNYNHLSFTVGNIEQEYQRLTKLGVKFLSSPIKAPDRQTKVCFGYDPDKNLIEFVQELKR